MKMFTLIQNLYKFAMLAHLVATPSIFQTPDDTLQYWQAFPPYKCICTKTGLL